MINTSSRARKVQIGAGLSGYVAEIASGFLCAAHQIVPTIRHADYIGSWLIVLKNDNRAIFQAASHAQKAADWLLDRVAQDATAASDLREAA